jgi:predicted ferric reductase
MVINLPSSIRVETAKQLLEYIEQNKDRLKQGQRLHLETPKGAVFVIKSKSNRIYVKRGEN